MHPDTTIGRALLATCMMTAVCAAAPEESAPNAPRVAKQSIAPLAESLQPDQIITYQKIGDRDLTLHIFQPKGFDASGHWPAFVVIHGGGWVGGTARAFYPYAHALAEQGYVGISVDYRLASEKGVTVFDCVKDARSAVRYVRAHAAALGIDPHRIAVAGGSAGGHLAAGTAFFDGIDQADDDLHVSCRPDALVLYFPVLDTSENGYGRKRIGDDWKTISALDQVKPGAPPTLVFHGDADRTVPYAGSVAFTKRMNDTGNVCELVTRHEGAHGYINFDIQVFNDAIDKTVAFLGKHLVAE